MRSRSGSVRISCCERSGTVKLVIGIVRPEKTNDVLEALCAGARTGEVGDGKIFVVPLERAIRIRTGETDVGAVTPVGA